METKLERPVFGWLTRCLLARLPSRRAAAVLVGVSARGLHFQEMGGDDRLIRWDAINQVTAVLSPGFAGDTAMLLLGLSGGGSASVTASNPGWAALTDNLHLHLTGAMRPAVWQLEMLGRKPVMVYRR